jgi:hypothetical protein
MARLSDCLKVQRVALIILICSFVFAMTVWAFLMVRSRRSMHTAKQVEDKNVANVHENKDRLYHENKNSNYDAERENGPLGGKIRCFSCLNQPGDLHPAQTQATKCVSCMR